MGTYLINVVQTPETLAKLFQAPEDRGQVLAPLFASLGGELLGYWYAAGASDVYVLCDLPDDVTAAGLVSRVTASGAFSSTTTTRLLNSSEMLAALKGPGGAATYRAPGRAG